MLKLITKPSGKVKDSSSLLSFGIVGAQEDENFTDITQLAAEVCNAPISIISLEHNTRKWFKKHVGISIAEIPSEFSIVSSENNHKDVLEWTNDELEKHYTKAVSSSNTQYVKFYASIPLINNEGYTYGSLNVLDYQPQKLNDSQKKVLGILAKQVLIRIDHLKKNRKLKHAEFTFDNSIVGIVRLNKEGAILECNKKYKEMVGHSNSGLCPKFIYDLDPQFNKENWKNYWGKLQKKPFLKIETQSKLKETNYRNIERSLSIHTNGNEQFVEIACHDITERKNIEQKYQENIDLLEENDNKSKRTIDLLEELQNIAHIGYWEFNLKNKDIFWSDETRKIHEVEGSYTPTYQEGINFYDDESKPVIIQTIKTAIKSGGSWNKKLKIVTAKGNKKWVRSVGKVSNEKGEPVLLYGLFADISEEIEIRKKVTLSQENYQLLANHTHEMVALHQLDGTYTYISPASKIVLGYEPEELIGKNPYDYFHPDDIERIRKESHEPVVQKNDLAKIECRVITKSGEYKWLEVLSKSIMSNDKAVAIITSSRDITERVEIQTELFENYKSLERAKEQAEIASNSKKQFLTTMSHEIRTPLNAINGLTHLLLKSNPREDQIENLKLLNFSGENLLNLINDILDISKIESGKLELAKQPFDLAYLLTNIQRSLGTKAKENLVNIAIKYDDNLPTIFVGDSARISQVLYNLVGNAIKFTKNGEVTILTSLLEQSGTTYKFRIGVKDNGIGISKEKQAKIFGSFEQADASISRQYGGTGLGLYISSKLVELMDSVIQLDSMENMGSYFYFDVQLNEGSMELEDLSNTNAEIDFRGKSIRALVAEDNTANQMIISKFLEMYNVDYEIAENGKEALEKIKSRAYNFVLMDLQMPLMDGFEATQKIRSLEDEYYKNVPIIALTADVSENVKDDSLASGMDDYLSKPFRPKDLVNIINKYSAKIGGLQVRMPKQAFPHEKGVTIPFEEGNWNSSDIEKTLAAGLLGDQPFKMKFLRKCNDNILQFKSGFKACIQNKDVAQLRVLHHNLITILRFFRLEFVLNNIRKLVEEGEGFPGNTVLIDKISSQINKVNADFEAILNKHE